jgi:hypothetical protein
MIRAETGFANFAVVGSWAAKEFVKAVYQQTGQFQYLEEIMIANDIDCFYGPTGEGPVAVASKPTYRALPSSEDELNVVEMENFSTQAVLDNNDVNATGVAIDIVFGPEPETVSINFHVTEMFWEWALSKDHILRAINPVSAKAKTLVRLAKKSLDMRLPFDDGNISPDSELLPKSAKDKVEEVQQGWNSGPFSGMTVKKSRTARGAMFRLAGDVNRSEAMGRIHTPPALVVAT